MGPEIWGLQLENLRNHQGLVAPHWRYVFKLFGGGALRATTAICNFLEVNWSIHSAIPFFSWNLICYSMLTQAHSSTEAQMHKTMVPNWTNALKCIFALSISTLKSRHSLVLIQV